MKVILLTGIEYPEANIMDAALRQREILMRSSNEIKSVESSKKAGIAVCRVELLYKLIRESERNRVEQKEKLYAICRQIDEAHRIFSTPLQIEGERIMSMVGSFNARQEELERKQLESGVKS